MNSVKITKTEFVARRTSEKNRIKVIAKTKTLELKTN